MRCDENFFNASFSQRMKKKKKKKPTEAHRQTLDICFFLFVVLALRSLHSRSIFFFFVSVVFFRFTTKPSQSSIYLPFLRVFVCIVLDISEGIQTHTLDCLLAARFYYNKSSCALFSFFFCCVLVFFCLLPCRTFTPRSFIRTHFMRIDETQKTATKSLKNFHPECHFRRFAGNLLFLLHR